MMAMRPPDIFAIDESGAEDKAHVAASIAPRGMNHITIVALV